MSWDQANTWANTLKAGDSGRYSGWRLPTIIDTGAPGCDYSNAGNTDCDYNVQFKSGDPTKYQAGQTVYSEMAHLWYVTLGNKGQCPPLAFCTGASRCHRDGRARVLGLLQVVPAGCASA